MMETISGGINILMAMWVLILIRKNAKLQSEAANMRLKAKFGDEVARMRGEGLL